jgi:hypothetical protein
MLLDVDDLPGDNWILVRSKSWRTGVVGPRIERARRARAIRSISVERKFGSLDESQTISLGVYPYASIPDALDAVAHSREALMPYKPLKTKVISEHVVEDLSPSGVDSSWAMEQRIGGATPGVRRVARGSIGRFVVGIASFAPGHGWAWSELAQVLAAQGEKVRRCSPGDE